MRQTEQAGPYSREYFYRKCVAVLRNGNGKVIERIPWGQYVQRFARKGKRSRGN